MESTQAGETFTEEQKEYLQGFFAGVTARTVSPFVGQLPNGRFTAQATAGIANLATQPIAEEQTVLGTPISDLCEQEIWKLEQHGLDIWDKLLAHAEENKFPGKADTFRFRYHGLFYVAPAQDAFMLRCRVPAGSQKIGGRVTPISRPARISRFERSHRNTSSKFFLSCKSLDLPHEVRGLITSETLLLLRPLESIQPKSSIRSHMPKRCTTIS